MRRGVVYACSHRDWIAETVRSSLSFARHMPDLERHLFIPAVLLRECRDDVGGEGQAQAFTRIVALERIAYAHRPRFESMLPVDSKAEEIEVELFLPINSLRSPFRGCVAERN